MSVRNCLDQDKTNEVAEFKNFIIMEHYKNQQDSKLQEPVINCKVL